jgi:DNA processing protein
MNEERSHLSAQSLYPWWCRLIRDRRWSQAQKRQLIDGFGCPFLALNAPLEQVRTVISGRQQNKSSLIDESMLEADQYWLSCDHHHLVSLSDPEYPALLRELCDPPLALFAIGNIGLLGQPQVAMVGSRKPTPVGEKVARTISGELANLGIVVTSGMALGIDGAAHRGALNVGGPSIAVLGNGLDTIYPARHKALFDKLSTDGLIVSEYPLGVRPDRYTFPQRNRIVSGLSYGVVIVEAAERSGTLITARLAIEQNRDVMVVPGSALSAQYKGSHYLLQQGAALVSSSSDVLNCLSAPLSRIIEAKTTGPFSEPADQPSVLQQRLLEHISTESTSVDDIILSSQLTSAEVSSMLLELELIGAVAISNDGGYVNLS